MGAGKYRHRLLIEGAGQVLNAQGEPEDGWVEVATVWGEKLPLTGRESLESFNVRTEQVVVFRTRYRTGITTDMRLTTGGVVHDIKGVADVGGRKRELEITAVVHG